MCVTTEKCFVPKDHFHFGVKNQGTSILYIYINFSFLFFLLLFLGAGCSSEVERSLMVRWVVDHSWGGPIELFLIPASAPRLVKQRPWYVLSCLWDGSYKKSLCCGSGFPFSLSEWSLTICLTPYNRR